MSDGNLKLFLCSFPYDGAEWSVEIYARDFDDAKRRLERIGTNGRVDGEGMLKISAAAGGGFIIPPLVWLRNLWKRLT